LEEHPTVEDLLQFYAKMAGARTLIVVYQPLVSSAAVSNLNFPML